MKDAFYQQSKVRPEAYSDGRVHVFSNIHPFIATLTHSYSVHIPLALTPDDIWIICLQGLAQHVNQNSEELREQFVDFDGKQEIIVYRDGFVMGSPDNDWEGVFDQFSAEIGDRIREGVYDIVTADFSTTTPLSKAAADVVLMDAVKSYFDYRVVTKCCIPRFHIRGSVEDWKKLRDRVAKFEQFKLAWWTDKLLPFLDGIIDGVEGKGNIEFWESFFKNPQMSGSDIVSGKCTVLFPYLESYGELTPNRFKGGIETCEFSSGMSKVPFIWKYLGKEFKYNFFAGFLGSSINDGIVAPQLAWGVAKKNSKIEDEDE